MYEGLVKSLRWLRFMFPETHPAQDDADRMSNNIHLYCTQAANAIEELSKPQNTVHLCTSCKYQYPECPADTGVVFGRGKGNDNICQCADYVARIPRWIPVTERLPEKDTRVIVCASLPEGVHSDFIYEDGHWFVSTGVTHWMPFPEPPKEE